MFIQLNRSVETKKPQASRVCLDSSYFNGQPVTEESKQAESPPDQGDEIPIKDKSSSSNDNAAEIVSVPSNKWSKIHRRKNALLPDTIIQGADNNAGECSESEEMRPQKNNYFAKAYLQTNLEQHFPNQSPTKNIICDFDEEDGETDSGYQKMINDGGEAGCIAENNDEIDYVTTAIKRKEAMNESFDSTDLIMVNKLPSSLNNFCSNLQAQSLDNLSSILDGEINDNNPPDDAIQEAFESSQNLMDVRETNIRITNKSAFKKMRQVHLKNLNLTTNKGQETIDQHQIPQSKQTITPTIPTIPVQNIMLNSTFQQSKKQLQSAGPSKLKIKAIRQATVSPPNMQTSVSTKVMNQSLRGNYHGGHRILITKKNAGGVGQAA